MNSARKNVREIFRGLRRQALDTLCAVTRRKVIMFNGRFVGVGNRLKALASFHRLHGLRHAHIYWCVDEWVNQPLTSAFAFRSIGPFVEHTIKPIRPLPNFYAYPAIPDSDTRGSWRLAVDDDLPHSFDYTQDGVTFPVIDFAFHSIPSTYVQSYLEFFTNVGPSTQVAARMQDVSISEDDVCVHVRIPANPKDRIRASPFECFVEAMRAVPTDSRFFVSAHNADVPSKLRQIFPGRIVELPGKRYDSLIDGTADLFLLSKGRSLIASRGSTFSEVAWWLGGAQQTVTCV